MELLLSLHCVDPPPSLLGPDRAETVRKMGRKRQGHQVPDMSFPSNYAKGGVGPASGVVSLHSRLHMVSQQDRAVQDTSLNCGPIFYSGGTLNFSYNISALPESVSLSQVGHGFSIYSSVGAYETGRSPIWLHEWRTATATRVSYLVCMFSGTFLWWDDPIVSRHATRTADHAV